MANVRNRARCTCKDAKILSVMPRLAEDILLHTLDASNSASGTPNQRENENKNNMTIVLQMSKDLYNDIQHNQPHTLTRLQSPFVMGRLDTKKEMGVPQCGRLLQDPEHGDLGAPQPHHQRHIVVPGVPRTFLMKTILCAGNCRLAQGSRKPGSGKRNALDSKKAPFP